ncbi:MAG: hypothetical protein KDK12_13570 [Rhodobacteraceae bacterium]|nr:hypothetical protein [Paracoccaceae bacterium]
MQIDSTKDFTRPRVKVLARFRSPERVEEVLGGMGITASRAETAPNPAWNCSIHWREADRAFTARLSEPAPDETMVLDIASDLANAAITMDFYDLPDGGCRVISKAVIDPRTMLVRLALQSLRLVRGKAEERLTRLVAALGRG